MVNDLYPAACAVQPYHLQRLLSFRERSFDDTETEFATDDAASGET
jgi:hypothetical protein